MLGLRQHIGSYEARIGFRAGKDDYFTGTGNHIHIHLAKNLPFGCSHEGITRTDNLVDSRNCIRSVSKSRNGLDSSHQINFRCVEFMQGSGNNGMPLECTGRCYGHNPAYAGNFGRDDVHQYG